MRRVLPSLAVLLLAAATVLGALQDAEEFPHEAHEGLFPLCEGCHVGIVTGEEAALFPDPASCAECHDGTRQEPVNWEARGPRASNLEFFHPLHEDLVGLDGSSATCQNCHAAEQIVIPAPRMAVAAAAPESCLECHVHEAPAHLSPAAECSVCHIPLTEAERIPAERIALFPWPDSHEAPGFISEHAPATPLVEISCGICHASNTCERCHVNADRLDPIARLASDPRVAELEEGKVAEYPVPESHLASGWGWDHGASALAGPAQCSTCHTRPSCTACHIEGGPQSAAVIGALPDPVPGGAPGVDLSHAAETLHPFDFDERHATFAATGALQCAECHSEQYCSDCHTAAEASSDFHPDNFLERHALEVFAGGSNCQSCHSTEAFCRDCHEQMGLASEGSLDVAFHTAQPMWILTHGQAARIGLESCASCHQQTDCLACHSTFLGRGVNPHGPGFDAGGMAARNRVTCRWCHLDDPLGGS